MHNIRPAPQPVKDALYREVERRRALYQERDQVMHNIRRYRLMRQKTWMPKAYARRLGGDKGVKLPLMYRLVQTAVGMVAKRFPTVYAEPFSIGDRKAAAEMTRAVALLLQAINTTATSFRSRHRARSRALVLKKDSRWFTSAPTASR